MITIPREVCRDLDAALTREWLVTNGIGGYASSTITGANTRRYHGLLVAPVKPPLARVVMLSKIDEEVQVAGTLYRLGTNEYESGTIHPDGYLFLERVELDGMIPTFFYQAANFILTKAVWMEYGHNITYVRYALDGGSLPIQLTLLPLCTHKEFHTEMRGSLDRHFGVEERQGEVTITAYPGATPYRFLFPDTLNFVPLDLWYWRFRHRAEQARGYESVEDLYLPGLLRASMNPGDTITLMVTTASADSIHRDTDAAFTRAHVRQSRLIQNARDDLEKQLFVSADQFIVQPEASKRTVIAGYHWFSDWGRDTLIALEGLALLTQRHAEAKEILLAWARSIDQGMLPNRFSDAGSAEYNAADVTLWYFHAIDRYLAATRDDQGHLGDSLLRELFPTLASIIDWHVKGTRYNIHVDPADGLLYAGEPGVPLTWMDAKVGDSAVTPRIGKPVEVNALWYRGLRLMEQWAKRMKKSAASYSELAARTRASFGRFWFAEGGYLYDVIDTPNGDDASLRPNQLFALSLADDLVSPERAKSILDIVTRDLLTPFGLRTLSPRDPNYHAHYRGDQAERDAAYHQGTVWPWLIGAYVDAHLKVYGDRARALLLLDTFRAHLSEAGLGTIGEIFEADPPFRTAGCIAQAWSVAQVLRATRQT